MTIGGLVTGIARGIGKGVLLLLQVMVAFGALWILFAVLSGQHVIPGLSNATGLGRALHLALAVFVTIGGLAMLFQRLCPWGILLLFPICGMFLVSRLFAIEHHWSQTGMVVLIAIIALLYRKELITTLRRKSLKNDLLAGKGWWRCSLYYGIPACCMVVLVGTLFFVDKQAECGGYELQADKALDQGKYEEAISNFKEAIHVAQRFPKSHWRSIQDQYQLGRAYLHSHQLALAENTFREAAQRSQRELDPSDVHYYLYYRSLHGLASTFKEQFHYPEAEALYLQIAASYAAWSPQPQFDYMVQSLTITKHLAEWVNFQDLISVLDQGKKMAADADLANEVAGVPAVLGSLAQMYMDQGQFNKAEEYLKRKLSLTTKILAPDFPDLGQQLLDVQLSKDEQGKPLEGRALYDVYRLYFKQVNIQNRSTIAGILNDLGLTYWEQGRYQESEPLYLRSLSIEQSSKGETTSAYAMTLTNLGLLYNSEGRYREAEPKLYEALAIRERILHSNDADLAHSYNNLALLYDNQNLVTKAIPLYEQALALRRKALGPSHPKTVLTLGLLANLYFRERQLEKAEPLFLQLLQLRQQELGIGHPNVLILTWKLAGIYSEQHKYTESLALYERMLPLMEQQFGLNHTSTMQARAAYAIVLRQAGKVAESEKVRKQLQELNPDIVPPLRSSKKQTSLT